MSSLTRLNARLELLEDMDASYRPLVVRMRQLMRVFDMKAIRALLDEVPHA